MDLGKRKLSYGVMGLVLWSLMACNGGSSTPTAKGTARLGALGQNIALHSSSLKLQSLTPLANPQWNEAAVSSNGYAMAKIDGLKLTVRDVWASQQDNDRKVFATLNKVLELRPDISTVNLEEDIAVPVGSYKELGVSLENKISIKAFCRVHDGTNEVKLYTTQEGVKVCSGCNDGDSLPADYDYYDNPFLETRLAGTPGATTSEGYKMDFEVNEDDSPQLALLVDTSYITACALHSNNIDNHGPSDGILPPFSWSPEAPQKRSDFYKDAVGYFGVGYVPIFTHISNDPAEDLPNGETYVASGNAAAVPNGNDQFDIMDTLITTIAFNADGDIVAARSRNFDSAHDTDLEQGWSGFVSKSDGSYSLMNGEHWAGAAADYSDARWLQDRKIDNFRRQTNFTTQFTVGVSDGPDCGLGLGDKNRDCRGSALSTYWKRVQR